MSAPLREKGFLITGKVFRLFWMYSIFFYFLPSYHCIYPLLIVDMSDIRLIRVTEK